MGRKRRARDARDGGQAGNTPTPRPPGAWEGDIGTLLWPCVCALFLWLPSLRGEFVYDDLRMVVNNPVLRDPANVDALLRFDPGRPLLTASWVASAVFGGLAPWAFRLPNIVLHAATAALVALLVRWLAVARGEPRPGQTGLVAGVFFACTPMAAETVAYISSRSTGLCACLGFAFLTTAVRELQAARPTRRALAFLFLLLAHATKEEAAAFPLLLVLLDLYGPAHGRLAEVAGRWRVHLPFLLVPAAGFVARGLLVGSWLPEPVWPYGRWLVTQAVEFPGYLLRALVPLDPAFHRGVAAVVWPPGLRTVLLVALLLALLAFVARRPQSRLAFAAAWMAVGLAPSSTLVPLKELVVDHRAYTGGFGAAWLAASALAAPGRGPLAGATLLVMAVRALAEQDAMATSESVWAGVVARNPDLAEARLGLGLARLNHGDAGQAVEHFRRVTELTPADPRGWSNLAAALSAQRRPSEAVDAMGRAVALLPGDSRMAFNLGALEALAGRMDLAERSFARAVDLEPPMPQAMINLAAIRLSQGDLTQAAALLARVEGLRVPAELRAPLARLKRELAARQAALSP